MDTKEGDGVSWETGTNTHTLSALYIKETTNENLLQSTGTSAQRSVVTRMGRRSEGKGYMRVDGKEVRGEGVYVRGWKGSRRGRDICAWMGRRSEGKGYMRVDGVYARGWEGVYARAAGSLLCRNEHNVATQPHTRKIHFNSFNVN